MSISTETIKHEQIYEVSPTRKLVLGIVEIIIAILIFFVFARSVQGDVITKFVMTPGGIIIGKAPDWIIPTRLTLIILTVLCLLIGGFQLIKGFGRATNALVGLCGLFLVFSFLTWQAAGKSLNLAGMLTSAVLLSVPITLGAFSGILSERAGVINIAIEGMMLMGSMIGALVGSVANNAWVGLLGAILSSLLLAAIHAVLSIKYQINQVISGTVINIFSAGMTAFLSQKFLQENAALNNPPLFPRIPIPGLANIPILGPIFFNTNLFVYFLHNSW